MSTRVRPGDVLGQKYKVERVLGTGGMGIVVAAQHIDLGQRVALKFMLREAMADNAHAERFLREAKAAVQLKSVHTARVLDVGRLQNNEPFMVMEYLEGRDLDAELQARGPMPPHVAVDYVLQASEALAEAHGLGMIHRDVKLKNLFLTSTVDGRPLVKVLDFGLAKQLGAHGDVSLTATNSVFGSPQYMSPEQMRSAKDVDHRSDVWSLGVCLYELLTGRVPFDASGVAEICAMVLKDPVPPPSQFVRGLPQDLEAVVLRCLEKDPSLRYQSIAELAFALQHYAADEGSARRILHVMQSAQKLDHPTIVTTTTSTPVVDAVSKTMNAWDSGLPTRRTTQFLTKTQFIAAVVGLLTLATIGSVAMIVVFRNKDRGSVSTASATMTDSPPPPPSLPISAEPPAPTSTVVGTVIGASDPAPPETAPLPNPPSPAAPTSETTPHTTKPGTRPASTGRPPATVAKPTPAPTPPSTREGTPTTPTKPPPKKNAPGSGAEYM